MQRLPSILLILGILTLSGALSATEDPPLAPEVRLSRSKAAPALEAGLTLREGRTLYRGPRSNMNRYPYLVAANAAELSKRRGFELRWSNLHRLLEPVRTPGAAIALTRRMLGGEVVPDRATFDRLLAAARAHRAPEDGWEVMIHDAIPEHFGLVASEGVEGGEGFSVRGTIFTTSGFGALTVKEIHVTIPRRGPATIERKAAISGPPQSWQTSGDVDEEAQRRLHRQVLEFRAALLAELRRERTLEELQNAFTEGVSSDTLRARLGEPLCRTGTRGHLRIYRLGDGRAVAFAATDDDTPIQSARLHGSYHLERGLGPVERELTPKGSTPPRAPR